MIFSNHKSCLQQNAIQIILFAAKSASTKSQNQRRWKRPWISGLLDQTPWFFLSNCPHMFRAYLLKIFGFCTKYSEAVSLKITCLKATSKEIFYFPCSPSVNKLFWRYIRFLFVCRQLHHRDPLLAWITLLPGFSFLPNAEYLMDTTSVDFTPI